MADEATPTGGKEQPDVNTEAGFYASIAKSAGIELDPSKLSSIEENDTNIESGLTYPESTEQPRNEKGQFVKPDEPAAPPAPEATEGAAPTGEDDPVAALLAQHGGDPAAALVAVIQERDNAQSAIGRQGEELGRLRALELEKAKLEGRLEAQQAAPPAAPSQMVSEAQIREAITNGDDPAQTAIGVMSWVVDNAPDMIETTERIWGEFDPFAAAAFRQDRTLYEAERERQKAPPAGAPAGTPDDPDKAWVAAQRTKEQINAALGAAFKDVPEGDVEALKPLVLAELQAAPQYEKDAINGGDEATQVAAFTNIVARARGKVTSEVVATTAEQAAAEALAGKQAATVLHGGQQPPKEESAEERTPEMVSKLLRDALLETETTSVADGLTYGNPQPGLAGLVR